VSSSNPSSQSNSSAEPAVSVVIGSNAPHAVEACLAALEPQSDNAEVLVLEAAQSRDALRERFPWASFVHSPGALVPELWRDGIDRSRGEIVALTIPQMVPAADWLDTIVRAHATHDAVGGAIDPADGLRLVDWAEYFCRYARDMRPFTPHRCLDLPGDNAAYKRAWLERVRASYRDGFWEPDVHRELADGGASLWHAPDIIVRQGRSTGWRAFARQRLKHGRAYGNQRGVRFSRSRNVAGVAGAPLVPFLMTLRVFSQVAAKRRFRLRALAALPLIFFFNTVWATAEARGHLDVLMQRG
jgi:hypothetical protein